MTKIGLMAFATALLLTGSGYAADKIALTCTGTLATWTASGKSETPAEVTLVIDLEAGLVSGDLGELSITSKDRYRLQFGKINEDVHIEGLLDRASTARVTTFHKTEMVNQWPAHVTTFRIARQNGEIIKTEMADQWELSCRRSPEFEAGKASPFLDDRPYLYHEPYRVPYVNREPLRPDYSPRP
jgi:hypothetical protein